MNEQQLKASIEDTIALLRALDTIIPGKLDGDLVAFLENCQANDWTLAMLHGALGKQVKLRKAV